MISKLLRLLEQNSGELDIQELSRQLGAQPSAVAGMLELLVRKGRINELGADCGICESCNLHDACVLPAKRARKYQLSGPGLIDKT